MREGVADLVRHPLNDPIPAGATDAGLELGPLRLGIAAARNLRDGSEDPSH
jgi:hypothetical protein